MSFEMCHLLLFIYVGVDLKKCISENALRYETVVVLKSFGICQFVFNLDGF